MGIFRMEFFLVMGRKRIHSFNNMVNLHNMRSFIDKSQKEYMGIGTINYWLCTTTDMLVGNKIFTNI